MDTRDYSALFDLVLDGAMRRYMQTEDSSILKEPARLMMLLRESLNFSEKVKLHEAIMATGMTAAETPYETIERLTE
jgi:hypothetical protein